MLKSNFVSMLLSHGEAAHACANDVSVLNRIYRRFAKISDDEVTIALIYMNGVLQVDWITKRRLISKEELTTAEALVVLEPSDLRELGLPLGQRKLLQRALLTLHPKEPPQVINIDIGTTTQPGSTEDGPELPPVQGAGSANQHDLQGTEPITIADVRCQVLNAAGKALDKLGLGIHSLATPQPAQAATAGTSLPTPRLCQPVPLSPLIMPIPAPSWPSNQQLKRWFTSSSSSENGWRNACAHRKGWLC